MPTNAKPFLKWAGGKRALAPRVLDLLPAKIDTYYEPMLGGGAVFFALARADRIQHAVLNDVNEELMACYRVVRDFPFKLVAALKEMPNDPETFERIRSELHDVRDPVRRAARTIYLNRTCFNGLYRLNKKGQFNVPYGKYKNPTIVDEPNLLACSEVLNRFVILYNVDFSLAVKGAQETDAVYIDPPYLPRTGKQSFTNYTPGGFSLCDHERLAAVFKQLVERSVPVILSNADAEVVRDLYEGFEMHEVTNRRSIGGLGADRADAHELLIVGRKA